MPGPPRIPIIDRVLARVEKTEDGCWVFTGARDAAGYGVVARSGKGNGTRQAHIVTYEHFVGPVPDGLELDHLCGNRPCVNPDDLEAVTHAENMARVDWERKTHCPQGHPYDDENTRWRKTKSGKAQVCRACHREQSLASYHRRKG